MDLGDKEDPFSHGVAYQLFRWDDSSNVKVDPITNMELCFFGKETNKRVPLNVCDFIEILGITLRCKLTYIYYPLQCTTLSCLLSTYLRKR